MGTKQNNNTFFKVGNATGKQGGVAAFSKAIDASIKTRDFERYQAAVEEYIKSTKPERPTTGRDKGKVG